MTETSVELTFVLPVKDGEEHLTETLEGVDAFVRHSDLKCEVIAVDDGSSDSTPALLREFGSDHAYLRVLTHDVNRGKGAALKTAAAAARGAKLLALDADATFPLDVLDSFLAKLDEGYDVAVGNRRDHETRFVLHPRHFAYIGWRHALGWVFIRLANVLLGIAVDDSQCGFKCYRTEIAKRYFPEVEDDRFAFDVELLALLQHHGCRVAELPLTYIYREQTSTLRLFRDGREMLGHLIRTRRKFRRLRRARGSRTSAPGKS